MYNPKGADTDHEWVEIVNQGNAPVDLSQCKGKASLCRFIESTSHELSVVLGSPILPSGAYAIIADNAQVFLSDHPGFLGIVFDSSFSLNNTSETISFRAPDGAMDTVSYTKDMGAIDDGNSLQKISGIWHGATPTPGHQNDGEAVTYVQTPTTAATTNSSAVSDIASFPVDPQIIADAGAPARTVSVGAPGTFSGHVFGLKKEPIENARLAWTFGDGGRAEGMTVNHTYYYPGDYIAVLDAASGYFSASDRVSVHVVSPTMSLNTGGDNVHSFVSIENLGIDEVDLSLWQIVAEGKTFIFPQSTVLAAKKKLTLASEVSGLITPVGSKAFLNFPNGTLFEMQHPTTATEPSTIAQGGIKAPIASSQKQVSAVTKVRATPASLENQNQEASVINAFPSSPSPVSQKESNAWLWYTSVAFLGALALLGFRFIKNTEAEKANPADEYEIVEEFDDFAQKEPDKNEPH